MPSGGRFGGWHGPSIKNPATYEALKRQGFSKSSAAAISNAALNKGYRRGVHGGSRGRGGGRGRARHGWRRTK